MFIFWGFVIVIFPFYHIFQLTLLVYNNKPTILSDSRQKQCFED